MCAPAALSSAGSANVLNAIAAGGRGLMGILQFRQSRAQARAIEAQAREEARIEALNDTARQEEASTLLGRNRLEAIASGLNPNAGSVADVEARNEDIIFQDMLLRRYGVAQRQSNLRQAAANTRAQGVGALAAGFTGAAATVLANDRWPMFASGATA